MTSLIATIVLAIVLFFTSYLSKRRFGVLGLALAAGALLTTYWAKSLTIFLDSQGVVLVTPPLSAMVQVFITLAPPALLLFSGPAYAKTLPRIVGAALFTMLAMTFLTEVLASILVLSGATSTLFQTLHDNKTTLVVCGVIFALLDALFMFKPSFSRGKKSSH